MCPDLFPEWNVSKAACISLHEAFKALFLSSFAKRISDLKAADVTCQLNINALFLRMNREEEKLG